MPVDIYAFSIVLLESFGIVSFLLALVFFKQSQKISHKRESLKKAKTDEVWNGPCYSYKWAIRDSMKRKKMLALTPALVVFIYLLMVLWIWFVGPLFVTALISGFGYVSLIALMGAAIILLQTNAFEAYGYSRAIQKVAPDNLSLQDEDYMEIAKEALQSGVARFLIIGVIFVTTGLFIRQIVDGSIYALVTYTRVIFQAIESLPMDKAFAVAAILIAILLYVPELMGQKIFRRVKLLTQKIWQRLRKQ